eukprot:TRINITY_DN1712_c0_g1_i1.p1 TRINITY_DN1712_c0_g1~~TRINITY_DN1712_c0_g1_i1.p1  ORF type:complete len:375 (+),score=66.56 TRINITY_DN1712_c0_g1_i1:476-1600(+)
MTQKFQTNRRQSLERVGQRQCLAIKCTRVRCNCRGMSRCRTRSYFKNFWQKRGRTRGELLSKMYAKDKYQVMLHVAAVAGTPERGYARRSPAEKRDDADRFEREYNPSRTKATARTKPRRESNEFARETASQPSHRRSTERQSPHERRSPQERPRDSVYDPVAEYEPIKAMQEYSYTDKELVGVSEQVPYNRLSGMFSTGAYQSMLPLFPYGMSQQPYAGMQPGYINPMMGMTYPIPGNVPPMLPQANLLREMTGYPLVDSEQNAKLAEEVKRLQGELKEANDKIVLLEMGAQSNSESKLRELQEKLRRHEMDAEITEKMLKSEIEALQHRNEVKVEEHNRSCVEEDRAILHELRSRAATVSYTHLTLPTTPYV